MGKSSAPQKPVKIDMGPEMHLWGGRRFGPRVIELDPADVFFQVEGEYSQKRFDRVKNDLIASVRRTHEANNKRLGIMAKELGDSATAENLRPAPIHETLPNVEQPAQQEVPPAPPLPES